jgi:predicted CopG family antitoxin
VNKSRFQEQIQKRTTVSLDKEVYQQLCKRGHFGESFSQLLKRLLDELDNLDRGVTKR